MAKMKKMSEYLEAIKPTAKFNRPGAIVINPVKETVKAVAFKAMKSDGAGYVRESVCWFPKSQVVELVNDSWSPEVRTFLVPTWLENAKMAEGYSFH